MEAKDETVTRDKELIDFGKRCIKNTNYARLPNIKSSIMDGIIEVIENKRVQEACDKAKVNLSINTIYAVYTSYCKFAVHQLKQNVKDFNFPHLGTFIKRESLIETIGTDIGKTDEQAVTDRRLRTLRHLKHFDPVKMKTLLKIKKKQWKL